MPRISVEHQSVPAQLREALGLYRRGRIADAERAYRKILAVAPRDPDVLYQYGVLAGQTGRLDVAEQCLGGAIMLRPREPAFHVSLGLLRGLQHRFTDAVACHDKALALEPCNVSALVGQGEALHELGDFARAEAAYRHATSLAPDAWGIRFGWATALTDLGHLEKAAKVYRELIGLNPGSAEAHFNLGTVLRNLGRLDEAAASFRAAVAARSNICGGIVELVSTLRELGRPEEALALAIDAMHQKPQSRNARISFATIAVATAPLNYSAETGTLLAQCLESDDIQHEDLAKAAAWQLRMRYRLDRMPSEVAKDAVEEAIATAGTAGCLADRLLHLLLAKTVNRDRVLEAFLTAVRHHLCFAAMLPAGLNSLLAALALQCFNNAYVFSQSEAEEGRVATLTSELELELARFVAPDPAFEQKLLVFTLYASPMALAGAAKLLHMPSESYSEPVRAVLHRCLAEPMKEAELARGIPTLGAVVDVISQRVREQYEENPYPRWLSLPRLTPVSLPVMLRRKFPSAALPSFFAETIEILVAGCGTGIQPISTALSLGDVRVLAVDLSRSSLAYASRMARRLGVSNISFLQSDLLQLGKLARQFPLIEAVGVLHHMADPMAGWRAMTDLLLPGGLMRVGLYSSLARTDVVAAREHIAALGLTATPRDIRAFRQRLLFDDETERYPSLVLSNDLYDLNGCRDLLFHVQEHRFTLPELSRMMAALGLKFMGFELPDSRVSSRYRSKNPEDPEMTDLTRWARFEEAHPEAFSGMYVFWCQRAPI